MHFCRQKKSGMVSQHYFLNNVQKEQQTIMEYVAALQKDIDGCEFKLDNKCGDCGKTSTVSVNSLFL